MMEGNAATAAVVPLLTWVNRFSEKMLARPLLLDKTASNLRLSVSSRRPG
jgi:hypothetical protein